jgi:hypothetical protein
MKSLNIKLPINTAQTLSSNGHFSPKWLEGFLLLNYRNVLPEAKLEGLTMNYTFKINEDLHTALKIKAIEHKLALNEFCGRLIEMYYDNYQLVKQG